MIESPDAAALGDLLGEPFARALAEGRANVELLAVPGLPDGTVWQVWVPSEPHMPRLVVGRGPGSRLRELTGRPQEFVELVADLPVSLPDDDTVIGYVLGFLAATRAHDELRQVAPAPEDIAWRPGSPDEERRRADFLATTPLAPQVRRDGDDRVVDVVVLVDQRAERLQVRVGAHGQLDVTADVIVDGLPLPVLH